MSASISASTSGVQTFASSVNTATTMNVPNGDAVWAFVHHGTASGQTISGVTDSAGNTYVQKDTFSIPGINTAFYLYVADAVTGSATLTVTATISANAILEVLALDITGQGAASFDNAGSATTVNPYPDSTLESATITPNHSTDLLVAGAFALITLSVGLSTAWTFNVAGTSTWVADTTTTGAGGAASTALGLGVYQASGGSGSQTMTGAGKGWPTPGDILTEGFGMKCYAVTSSAVAVVVHPLPALGVGL